MRLTGLMLGLLLLLATGCGSTVQARERVAVDQQVAGGGRTAGATGPSTSQSTGVGRAGAPAGTTGLSPEGTVGAATGAGAASSSGVTSPSSGDGRGIAQPSVDGPGVTASTVLVGIAYAVNARAANAAIGGSGITTGSEPSDAKAVIDAWNKKGGLLGRKIVPLFYQRDAQSSSPVANQAQSECAFFTQDHKVFAALLSNGPVDWAEKPCLNKAGVPTITSHIASLDDGDPSLSWDSDVAGMSERSLLTAQLASIASQHWLSGWNSATGAPGTAKAKVGVVSYDLPVVNKAVQQVLLPGLRTLGAPVDPNDVFRIAIPQATSDDAAAEAALQNAALKLHSDNVDHVVIVDNGGAMTLLLANNLNSQHYLPRLAGTSSNGFQALLTGGDIPKAVLAGLVGAGWEPVIDLPFTDAGATATRASCLKVLHAARQSFADSNAEAVALGYCDKLDFLHAVVQKAGRLSTAAYLSALDQLGPLATSRGLGSRFAAGRHDGGNGYRDFLYSGECGCIGYAGPIRTIS